MYVYIALQASLDLWQNLGMFITSVGDGGSKKKTAKQVRGVEKLLKVVLA